MAEALRIIRERDGLRGLRRGMLPRVLTVAPSTAISWLSYEFFSGCSPSILHLIDFLLFDLPFTSRSGIVVAPVMLMTVAEVLIRQGGALPETGSHA